MHSLIYMRYMINELNISAALDLEYPSHIISLNMPINDASRIAMIYNLNSCGRN
jgi:hypothetical protein